MRLRWLIIAAVLAIPALLFFSRQLYRERSRAAQQLVSWEQEQEVERRLEQLVDIPVGEGLAWRDWASEFTRQTGLEFSFRDEPYLNGMRVFRDANRQPARLALDVLSEGIRGHWYLERGRVCIASLDDHVVPPTDIRSYALDPSISPAGKRQMEELLRGTMFPLWKRGAADYGELIDVPGQFVIAQNHRVQARIAQVWPRLQTCLREANSLPAMGLDPADPRLAPVVLDAPSLQRDQLLAALEKPLSLDIEKRPLKEVIEHVAELTGLTIDIPRQLKAERIGMMADAELIKLDEPVTLKVKDLPLKTVLRRLLRSFDVSAVPSNDYRLLRLIPSWELRDHRSLRLVAFAIPDFPEQQDQQRLTRLMLESFEADGGERYGSVASLRLQGKLLIVSLDDVSLDDDALPRIEGLLRAVRSVRAGRERWASVEFTSAEFASDAREDVLRPKALERQTQVLDARALLASRRCEIQFLKDVLIASVNHEYWSDRGAVVSIVESQGLLVVNQRRELLAPIRHALASIERHYFSDPAQRERDNLVAPTPNQTHPNAPQIYVYAVEDLLAEKDSLSIHHFKYDLQTTTLKRSGKKDDLPIVIIHGARFLIAHLHADQVAPLEAKLASLRESVALEQNARRQRPP